MKESMAFQDSDEALDDPIVLHAAREYLSKLEAGGIPDRAAIIDRYPQQARQLQECFDGIDLAHCMQISRNADGNQSLQSATIPLGDFQIVREIARGGMGVVYEAMQLSLGRRVALKVLPFAAALDERQLQRFRIESQAAAQLHHTNIVPVYAVGCERGVHYYAMQLIEGMSLADLLKNLRATRDGDMRLRLEETGSVTNSAVDTLAAIHSSTLTAGKTRWKQVAQWIVEIADALEFAHAAGVIHRDIKPANLLVDDKGRIWIADFGLAYVASDVSMTRSGELVGTLRYMSPEQAQGQRASVDHRTDVYSLGATLYELLTLCPLFPAEDRAALLYQILHEDPRPPHLVEPAVPRELETIVLKSLAKSAAERYSSAAEMAEDLRRYLTERPILAKRPTLLDRTRKWFRRHPGLLTAAALLLLFAAIASSIAASMIWNQQLLTQQALQREQQRAREAESRFLMARRVADELIQLAEDESLDEPFQEGLRTRLLETALQYYQEFIDQRKDEPLDQVELLATQQRVQQILDDLAVLRSDRSFLLLRDSGVLSDLQVSVQQQAQLEPVLDGLPRPRGPQGVRHNGFPPAGPGVEGGPFPPSQQALHPIPPQSPPYRSREELISQARQHEQLLSTILTDQQLNRLDQIALQLQGFAAFRDYRVIKTLGLTDKQQEQFKRFQLPRWDHRSRPGEGPRHSDRPAPPSGAPLPLDSVHTVGPSIAWSNVMLPQVQKAVERVLSEAQLRTWTNMIGQPFEID